MQDSFKTFNIQFSNREKFNLALIFLEYFDRNCFDIGNSDMIIAFFKEIDRDDFINELSVAQIFTKPSFKGEADFIVEKN